MPSPQHWTVFTNLQIDTCSVNNLHEILLLLKRNDTNNHPPPFLLYLYCISQVVQDFIHKNKIKYCIHISWLHILLWTKGLINGNLSWALCECIIKIYCHTRDQWRWILQLSPVLNSIKSAVWSATFRPNLLWRSVQLSMECLHNKPSIRMVPA